MDFPRPFLRGWAAVVLLSLAALVPLIFHGLTSVGNDTTDMRQWLPDGQPEKAQYDELLRTFGPDDVVVVSWPGCRLDDPRLPALADGLRNSAAGRRLFRRVATGRSLLAEMTGRPARLSRDEALRRLRGIAVGPDGETCCALLEFTPAGKQRPHDVVQAIVTTARQSCGLSRDDLRIGGGVYEVVVIDEESQRSLEQGAGLTCLIGLTAAVICLRSLWLTASVLATGAYCSALSVALVYFTGASLNAVMIVMPTLVFVLVVSGSVHLVNYYRDALETRQADPATGALAAGWAPCTLATVTTAFGLLSLAISQIRPIRTFGLYAAAGLLASLPVMLASLHAAFTAAGRGEAADEGDSALSDSLLDRYILVLLRRHRLAAAGCLLLFLIVGVGLLRTRTSVQLERMFRADNELIRNYEWLEQEIGPLASLEIVLAFPADDARELLERLELVREVARAARQYELAGGVVSAATYWPDSPAEGGMLDTMRRVAMNRRLTARQQQLIDNGLLADTEDGQLWRITLRLPGLRDLDFGQVIGVVKGRVAAVLDGSQVQARYTGAFPVIQSAQKQLLNDLINSFLLAFALICPVIMVILRGVGPGLAAMLVNVAPAAAIFGGMGWLGVPVDMGTVLTASVALGIAVDDTLHLLTWFRRGLNYGMTRPEAVGYAIRRCAPAMIQTTMICGLGMLAMSGSSFVPVSRFAWLMLALLIAALIGDLVLLPALLAGAVGRMFGRERESDTR